MEMPNFEKMSLKEQLLFVETYCPDAWEFLQDVARLPKYDDNDELITKEGEKV